jgi:hypothetical protein
MNNSTIRICFVIIFFISIFCLNLSCKNDDNNGSNIFIEPTIDGLIYEGEYVKSKSIGLFESYKIYWSSDESFIYMALEAKTNGWIAIGFQPDDGDKKRNVDFILGYVANGETFIFDMFSEKDEGPHRLDEGLGGSNNILEFSGTETNGYTYIEFIRALNTGDPYDYIISAGSIDILWAYSLEDSLYTKEPHKSHRGYSKITV